MTTNVFTQDRPIPVASTGCTDIVGFGLDGVVILRNAFRVKTFTAIKDFGYNVGGWRVDKHVRLVADMTGDGTGDLVGFGENGVLISFNNGNNSFSPVKPVSKDFGCDNGWRVDHHIRYLADIRGVGRCDLFGFAENGVAATRNDGNGKFGPHYVALNSFGYAAHAGGWRLDRHLRFLGDVTGDGLPDIVGFGENHVCIGHNNGNGTFAPAQVVIPDFCYAQGWRVDQHPRFIADLTGDGKVDVVGCGHAGVSVSLNQGNGVFGPMNFVVDDFGIAQGWKGDQHPRFIADLTGDKRGDIIGFGDEGVSVAYNNGNGTFQPVKFVLSHFGVQQGWKVHEHPRFVVDLTGDGCADIVGFGDGGVYVSYNDGKGGFKPVETLTSGFASNDGKWSADKTVRWVANVS